MELVFLSQDQEISPSLIAFATQKFQPLTQRYPQITNANICFAPESVTATLLIHGTEIHAVIKNKDNYHALDALVEKLLGLMIKKKDKNK